MGYIKTTNCIQDSRIVEIIREVDCPYCKAGLRGIAEYITAMKCWNCKKEFRIEQNKDNFSPIDAPSTNGKVHKTLVRGNQIL